MRIIRLMAPGMCATLMAAGSLGASVAMADQSATGDIEPRVITTLQKMVDYFGNANSLTFKATTSTEDVSSTLQKLQFDSSIEGMVQRPNKVMLKKSGREQMTLWYDGQTVTILDRKTNKYARAAVNGDLHSLVKKLDELGIEAPFAGLLDPNIIKHVEDHVFKGDYYGSTELDGAQAIHLAFRQDAVDWQLWTDSATGAPKKVVITSKMLAAAPEHILVIKEVSASKGVAQESLFDAALPADATEVPIMASGANAIRNSNW